MSKVQSLFDWYWVLLSLWFIGIGVETLFHLAIPDLLMGILALAGGIFWFFSGASSANRSSSGN